MEEWKKNLQKQYEDIPVPEEAKERIKEGIRMAKMEKKHGNGIWWLKRAGGTAVAAAAAFTILVNVSPTVAQAMEKVPVIGTIAQVVTFRTYEDHRDKMEAEIQIPSIGGEGQSAEANQDIEQYANSLIQMYEEEVREHNGQGNYSLTSTYEVVFENQQYVSIRINTTLIMASGTEYVKVFNVDKNTGKVVGLKEVLGNDQALLDRISEEIKTQMRAQMAEDSNKIYFLDSDMPDTDFKGLTGEESYYFNKDGQLVIVFDEYTVAPGYMGSVEFTIPEEITGQLVSK